MPDAEHESHSPRAHPPWVQVHIPDGPAVAWREGPAAILVQVRHRRLPADSYRTSRVSAPRRSGSSSSKISPEGALSGTSWAFLRNSRVTRVLRDLWTPHKHPSWAPTGRPPGRAGFTRPPSTTTGTDHVSPLQRTPPAPVTDTPLRQGQAHGARVTHPQAPPLQGAPILPTFQNALISCFQGRSPHVT